MGEPIGGTGAVTFGSDAGPSIAASHCIRSMVAMSPWSNPQQAGYQGCPANEEDPGYAEQCQWLSQ